MYDKDLNYLFNEVSLYTKDIFDIFVLKDEKYQLDKEVLNQFLCYIGCLQEKLITYCHKCKKEFPFSVEKEIVFLNDGYLSRSDELQFTKSYQYGPGTLSIDNGNIFGAQPPYAKDMLLNNKIWYIHYYFTCTNDISHNYNMMISVELKDGKLIIRKVGQNPSMLTVKGFDFDKYKKQLEEINAYDDYKKADLSNADHFYVGAYAYLRRIFEKMINNYLDGTELKDDHMDTKIDAVKNNFDPRVQKLLKSLYGILSISIHELDEEQSKEYYEYLKTIIDMQLEYIKTESDKDSQSKSLESIINKIKSGITIGGK